MFNLKQKIKNRIVNIIINTIQNLDSNNKAKLFSSLKSAYAQFKQNTFREKYTIDNQFRFNGDNILFYGNGKIICGKNSYIGNLSTIQSGDGCTVKIGDNCSISHNVRMYTTTNESNQDLNTDSVKLKRNGDIVINDGVWIGSNVFINPGVIIGENAIVGSNSVVTKNIEPYSIYGGVPAKLIKYKNYSK